MCYRSCDNIVNNVNVYKHVELILSPPILVNLDPEYSILQKILWISI